MAAAFLRQTLILVRKNLIINLRRHFLSTLIRATLLPVIYIAFLSFSRNLLLPPVKYGVGSPAPVIPLDNALAAYPSRKLVFINEGLGGEVDELIDTLQNQLQGSGRVVVLNNKNDLLNECRQSLRGSSMCFAAVQFLGSPKTGESKRWNYTIRGDFDLSKGSFDVEKSNNDVQKSFTQPGFQLQGC